MSNSRISVSPSPASVAAGGALMSSSSSMARAAAITGISELDLGKRVTELEIENSKIHARLAIAEREVLQKDQEMKRLLLEHRTAKASLERLIKDLVDKNKQQEAEFQRKLQMADSEARRASSQSNQRQQHSSEVKSVLEEWRRAFQQKEAEADHWQAQCEAASKNEWQLQSQLDEVHERATVLEAQLAESHRVEAELQQDLDSAVGKLQRADEHIHRLSEEAETHTVELVRLKHLSEASEVDAQLSKERLEELEQRFERIARHAASEIDHVTVEVEALLRTMRDTAVTISGQQRRRVATEASTEASAARTLLTDSLRQSVGDGGQVGSEQIILLLKRGCEALSLAREDIAVSQRAATELEAVVGDAARRVEILTEALQHERKASQEATDKLQIVSDQLEQSHVKIVSLEASVAQSTRWMDEAATLSQESAQRTAKLMKELNECKSDAAVAKEELSRLQRQLQALSQDKDRLLLLTAKQDQELDSTRDRVRLSEKRLAATQGECDDLRNRLSEQEKRLIQLEATLSQVEGEKHFLVRQVSDLEDKIRGHGRQTEMLESSNADLRSKLFDAQKRLDALVRAKSTTATANATSASSHSPQNAVYLANRDTPPRQRSASGTAANNHGSASSPAVHAQRSHTPLFVKVREEVASAVRGTQLPPRHTDAAISESSEAADRVKSWEDRLNALLSATRSGRGGP